MTRIPVAFTTVRRLTADHSTFEVIAHAQDGSVVARWSMPPRALATLIAEGADALRQMLS